MHRRVFMLCLLWVIPATLLAQEPWKTSYYPYLVSDPTNGVMLVASYQRGQAADYFDRVPFAGLLTVEAGASARGSRFASLRFRGPLLIDGWRVAGEAAAVRQAWYGFFDQGDPMPALPAPPIEGADLRERVHRTRYLIRGDVTRRIAGPLQVALGGTLQHARFTRVPGASVFRALHGDGLSETDAMGRFAVVLDTRNKEFVPANGVFVEAGVFAGTGGDGYTGAYGVARGYVSPRESTVFAGRIGFRALSGTPTLDAGMVIPTWERPIDALGGIDSHRSFVRGRFRGRGVLFGAAEIRQDFINAGDYGAITFIAFVEGGRTFRDGLDFTTEAWQVGGGGGIMLRLLRSTLLSFNFAGGPDGFQFMMGTGWSL